MQGIEWLVDQLGNLIRNNMAEGPLKDLLIDGIIGGVGGVIVFLPNILILYFFISILEDSGYMARAAFIMDKIMHRKMCIRDRTDTEVLQIIPESSIQNPRILLRDF